MKDLLARFTTDVIGTYAFGIDCNSLNDPDVEFRKMGNKMFELPSGRIFKFFFISTFKNLARKARMKSVPEDVSEFFFNVVRETIDYREKSHVQRNDFMNLLMQLMEKGELEGSDEKVGTLSMNEVVAQAFVFFLGGFETSSTTMSYCLYELSLYEDIQERARECVQSAIAKHGGFNYDAVMDMDYLEQCINGRFPSVGNDIQLVYIFSNLFRRIPEKISAGCKLGAMCNKRLSCAQFQHGVQEGNECDGSNLCHSS